MDKSKTFLCQVTDLKENSSKGFSLNTTDQADIFLVKRHDQIYAYENKCPHTGVSLNWQDDIFLDYDELYIQCSVHGARFEVETGLCVWGPCVNQSLRKVETVIQSNDIYLPIPLDKKNNS